MRSFRHWSRRYIFDRLCLIVEARFEPSAPWLTKSAVQILQSWLRHTDGGLEWGSGRSTAWLATRVHHLVSVEHDERWFALVQEQLKAAGIRNVDYRLRRDEHSYTAVAREVAPESLDFVLIDGVFRDRCALAAISLVKRGGLLIVDNSNWYLPGTSVAPGTRRVDEGTASPRWAEFATQVANWRSMNTTNGVTDTTFWMRPS